MTDERDENSQKDEAGTLLGCYISYSNRTKLLFYRHLHQRQVFFSPTAKQIARGSKRGRICQGYRLYDGGMEVQLPFHSMETLGTVCGTGRAHLGQRACPTWARCLPIS